MTEYLLGSLVFSLLVLVLTALVLSARAWLLPAREHTVVVNGRQRLIARSFQKLLPVLADAGIAVPSTCGGVGTCGLCRVTVTSGGGEPTPTELARIDRVAVRAGARLACQVVVRDDLEVEVPDELFGVQRWTSTLRHSRTLAPFIAEIVLELPAGLSFDFRAGAYVQVTVPPYALDFADVQVTPEHGALWGKLGVRELHAFSDHPVTRAYSLANRPQDRGVLVLNVRLALPPPGSDLPPGVASSYLFGLERGATVEISGPYGDFYVRPGDRELVLIGGGAGMAPLRAMIFDQLERVRTPRTLSFWYGARSRVDLLYVDEFDLLQDQHPNFRWTPALSEAKPEDDWRGAAGFIHQVVLRDYLEHHPAPRDCDYYLCGPPLMTQAVYAMLDELVVERSHVFNDDFGG